jgi:hypothetical protein
MRQGLQGIEQVDAGQGGTQGLVLPADDGAIQQEQRRTPLRDERLVVGRPAHAGLILAQVGA